MKIETETAGSIAQEAMKATPEQLAAFLDHIENRPCEACGYDKWHTPGQGKLLQLIQVGNMDNGFPLLALMCGSCGNVRTFSWGRVRYFLQNEYNPHAPR